MGKHNIKKDIFTRKWVKKLEIKNLIYKYNFNSIFINKKYKIINFYFFLKNFHLNSSLARVVNTCVYTGRSHWILRKFKLSRMSFREVADKTFFVGVRRASW
jgi:small subunit ribosomal protein S14